MGLILLLLGIAAVLMVLGVAPTPTARADPSGIMLENGYRSLITLAVDTNIELWEIEVTPPGLDGGDPIDTTTMHNDSLRTKAPQALKDLMPFDVICGYDPIIYQSAFAIINSETTITVRWPDGTTLAFYGYLQKFEPDALVEGELPKVTCTFVPTNVDPTTGDEEAPVLTNVSGS